MAAQRYLVIKGFIDCLTGICVSFLRSPSPLLVSLPLESRLLWCPGARLLYCEFWKGGMLTCIVTDPCTVLEDDVWVPKLSSYVTQKQAPTDAR